MKSFFNYTKAIKREDKKYVKIKVNVNLTEHGLIWSYSVYYKNPWDKTFLPSTYGHGSNYLRKLGLKERRKLIRELNLNHVTPDEVSDALQEAWLELKPKPHLVI